MLNNILDTVINIVKNKTKNESSILIDRDTSLSSLEINSITSIEIIVALEMEYKFEFDDEKLTLSTFPTILSIAEYIESKVQYSF